MTKVMPTWLHERPADLINEKSSEGVSGTIVPGSSSIFFLQLLLHMRALLNWEVGPVIVLGRHCAVFRAVRYRMQCMNIECVMVSMQVVRCNKVEKEP
jgi:hypothetical protein